MGPCLLRGFADNRDVASLTSIVMFVGEYLENDRWWLWYSSRFGKMVAQSSH